jgi:hypothetical protein
MLSDWVSFLAYHNLFRIKGFVDVVVDLLFFVGESGFCARGGMPFVSL